VITDIYNSKNNNQSMSLFDGSDWYDPNNQRIPTLSTFNIFVGMKVTVTGKSWD
jgi:hypothetical protein